VAIENASGPASGGLLRPSATVRPPGRLRHPLVALRALGLGDLLTGVPTLRALAAAFPEHRRILAAPAWLEPALALVGDWELHAHSGLAPLPAGAAAPDVAVNLHGRGPQSHRVLLATRPRRLVAFAHEEVPDHAGPAFRDGEHEVGRWCRLLTESGIPADPSRLELPAPAVAPPAQAVGATLLHHGGKGIARRWPAERWAAVARAELAAGRRVVLTGSAQEAPAAHAIARVAGLPDDAVLAGLTDLEGLLSAVAVAGRVVATDTGVAHAATAFATPSVVLFGPVSPHVWGPPPCELHRVVWSGRTGDEHADRPDPGLLSITVEQVVSELRALDDTGAPRMSAA
jgi:ADP-heptose:LPS heptosyltransferase